MPEPSSTAVRLGDVARAARTGALRVLSPLDRAWRALRGRPELPPLWLRRHVGPLRHYETAARDMARFLGERGLVEPGDLVVDLGCGCGAMAPALGAAMGPEGSYLGLDVHGPSLRWCRERWRDDSRYRFARAEVESPYASSEPRANERPGDEPGAVGSIGVAGAEATAGRRAGEPGAGGRATGRRGGTYRVPADDASAGLVLAKSVFTHLLAEQAAHYLAEIHRLLAPGRRAVVTAFLFADPPPAFPHGGRDLRWRLASRPHAAVAYRRDVFERMVADAGLEIAELVPGFWPGTDRPPRGQDVLVLAKPATG